MVRHHMVCLDGKEQSKYAFEWYLNNLYRKGDEVMLFHCSTFTLHVGLPGAAVNVEHVSKQVKEAQEKADAITNSANEELKHRGIKGFVVLKSGKPEDAILSTLQEHQVDHIIMGTRDLGSVKRALIGSVSTAIARTATVPVTVVKMEH